MSAIHKYRNVSLDKQCVLFVMFSFIGFLINNSIQWMKVTDMFLKPCNKKYILSTEVKNVLRVLADFKK